jgi:prophage maintenance system killer protein
MQKDNIIRSSGRKRFIGLESSAAQPAASPRRCEVSENCVSAELDGRSLSRVFGIMFDLNWLCPEVRIEYQRWMDAVPDDPYLSATTLGIHDVLRAHFLIANYFYLEGEGLGGIGPRDLWLLHSAISRQHVGLGVVRKWTTKFEVCATLLYGLIMDHPFHDANKRTAFLSALYYLHRSGRIPSVSHKEFEDFAVEIADHKLGKYARYASMIKDKDRDAEVRFISYWLKTHTRDMDKRFYAITYRDLKRLLNAFGCDIVDPSGNYIDVVKEFIIPAGFLRKQRVEVRRVGQIGFPGWGGQVGQGAIGTVRKVCELTPAKGVDSQVFFRGVDDLQTLIVHYEEPLRHLADR